MTKERLESAVEIPFTRRHIGASKEDWQSMLDTLGYANMDDLTTAAVPEGILDKSQIDLPEGAGEFEALKDLEALMEKNVLKRSLLGMGYADTKTPSPIRRNILENPGWYTQYTPYQSEIAQGRLEALINFQTMVADLTGLPISNSSLLDEATGAAEAMNMAFSLKDKKTGNRFLISKLCHPQTKAVVKTRAKYLGIEVEESSLREQDLKGDDIPFAVLVQYPATDGTIPQLGEIAKKAKENGTLVIAATDLLALTVLESPGALGADIAIGNSQRFGVPLGYGGPHAGFIGAKEGFERKMPGRMVGASKDASGKLAYRLALATREQHIRRDRATSNICTSQVLLGIMAGMYAVYHGPAGLTGIAKKVLSLTDSLKKGLKSGGYAVRNEFFFDTLAVQTGDKTDTIMADALKAGFNLRRIEKDCLVIALDEKSSQEEVARLLTKGFGINHKSIDFTPVDTASLLGSHLRKTDFLTHPVFHEHRSETALMRYIKKLENRDLSLTHAMIPLGSCTMKLNAASELLPVSWPKVNSLHPFCPQDQAEGYRVLFGQLESYLAAITGFAGVSLQPNSGAQGEYAGLLVIRRYHEELGEGHRNICLIPTSAHGTNPASAVLAGMKVVAVKCHSDGDVSIPDLRAKAEKYQDNLGALMVTYPSTHGVFEKGIQEICDIVHQYGGQVYMDGANLQAQIGLCRAGEFGPDVCHLNLHKTFAIPHGGGGPGMGPIAVRKHLTPHLPAHPTLEPEGSKACGAVSAAPWGSASILPISWMYIRMMGGSGLATATQVAILNANYIAKRLKDHFPVVYTGNDGLVAHECIIDLKAIKKATGVDETDVAKRLMDYGFHAPTVSWPVPASMMIEPTESEPKEEIDRFCEAMIQIRQEIKKVEDGVWPKDNNPLKMAPHAADVVTGDEWDRPYKRSEAAYPLSWVRAHKFWPFVSRVDNAYGDRNLMCLCPSVADVASDG